MVQIVDFLICRLNTHFFAVQSSSLFLT
jgi:hypothetical protein